MTPITSRTVRYLYLRFALAACAVLLLGSLANATGASADFSDYGIESVGASLSTLEAGRHPDVTTEIRFNPPSGEPIATSESIAVELPPGLVANPARFPTCSLLTFNTPINITQCPQDSQVGMVELEFNGLGFIHEPLYLLDPPEDQVVRLGFVGLFFGITLDVDLRSGSDYGATISALHMPTESPPRTPMFVKTTAWGVPADPAHDSERTTPFEAYLCPAFGVQDGSPCMAACPFGSDFGKCFENGYFPQSGESRKSGLAPAPFMSSPASCGPMEFRFKTAATQQPGRVFEASASAGEITGCNRVPFDPVMSLAPTSSRAGASTGLEATLEIPQEEAVSTVNSSPLRSTKVVLPEGMTVNSSAADGLQGCSIEQAGFGTPDPSDCPDASKLGTVEITAPALKRPIHGGIYLRTPEPGHLFRFWLATSELGVNLKLPMEVELDQATGRLTTVIHESPQLPAEKVVLRFNGGPRAPLRNPQTCGTYKASYELSPWSGNPAATGAVPFSIDQGCDTGGFDPKLSAGTTSPTAAAYSPFVFDISREDGEQNLTGVDVTLPKGLAAKFAGVPLCPESAAGGGACPAGSQIGVVKAATGAGPQPLWIPQPGKSPTAVYLAGPYKGAPYSVVATVPAQAGPFDLGLVSVRSAIQVDPVTAQGTVKSDPLPQILQGVPIDYRRVRVEIDHPGFTLNPTSCEEQRVEATVHGSGGATATPSERFQAADCASLGFAPKLNLALKGGTKRGGHPALRAVLRAKDGQANLRQVTVALPHSEFLDQAHIGTVCTRVQFAADACPAASIYGHARATTPLLDGNLEGPVYLRSSNHPLPDLVMALRGTNGIEIEAAGRIDSFRGGIRTTFEALPDAPIKRVVLEMKGGKKGLLINSTDICSGPHRATAGFRGQNGKVKSGRPVLRAVNCGK